MITQAAGLVGYAKQRWVPLMEKQSQGSQMESFKNNGNDNAADDDEKMWTDLECDKVRWRMEEKTDLYYCIIRRYFTRGHLGPWR